MTIGDTICVRERPSALRRITVVEPTVLMRFCRSDGPLAGREGLFVESTRTGERIYRETLKNVSTSVEDAADHESFIVKGRGQNAILTPVSPMTLERAIRSIAVDELVEVTPRSSRPGRQALPEPGGPYPPRLTRMCTSCINLPNLRPLAKAVELVLEFFG